MGRNFRVYSETHLHASGCLILGQGLFEINVAHFQDEALKIEAASIDCIVLNPDKTKCSAGDDHYPHLYSRKISG